MVETVVETVVENVGENVGETSVETSVELIELIISYGGNTEPTPQVTPPK